MSRALVVEGITPVIALARASGRDLDLHFLLGRSRALGWGRVEAGQPAHDGDGLGVLRLVLQHEAPECELRVGHAALQPLKRCRAHPCQVIRELTRRRQIAPGCLGQAVLAEEVLPFRMGIGTRYQPQRLRIGDMAEMPADRAEGRVGLGAENLVVELGHARQEVAARHAAMAVASSIRGSAERLIA